MQLFCLIPLGLLTYCLSGDWQLSHLPKLVPLSFNNPEPKVSHGQGLNAPPYLFLRSQPRPRQQNQYFLYSFFSITQLNLFCQPNCWHRHPPYCFSRRISTFILRIYMCVCVCVSAFINFLDQQTVEIPSLLFWHRISLPEPRMPGHSHTVYSDVHWCLAATRWAEALSKINFLISCLRNKRFSSLIIWLKSVEAILSGYSRLGNFPHYFLNRM